MHRILSTCGFVVDDLQLIVANSVSALFLFSESEDTGNTTNARNIWPLSFREFTSRAPYV